MQQRKIALTVFLGLGLMLASSAAMAQYSWTNLDSNQLKWARHTDPLLGNAWGLARSAGSPFWISDNTTGWSTIYDSKGDIEGLKVVIPTNGGNGPGSPTGIVSNSSSDFQLEGWPTFFLFATLDGTISGWAPKSNFNSAIVAVNNSASKASYTGLAITNKASGNVLFAADNANNKVDMYDANFNLLGSFTDSTLPTGFAPFGIQDINGLVYVTFASTTGAAGGYVEVFQEDGTAVNLGNPLISGGRLNQPWGIAWAPNNFGPLSNTILISNNTNNGMINAFNAQGQFVGTVKDSSGKPIVIEQIWGIEFGGGTASNGAANQLFYTAGADNGLAGTFGVISPN